MDSLIPREPKLRRGDVVQIRPRTVFLGRRVGGSVCTVVDSIPGSRVVDLLLTDRHGRTILATSNEVTYLRHEVMPS